MQPRHIAIIVAGVLVLIVIAVGAFMMLSARRHVIVGGQPATAVSLPTAAPTADSAALIAATEQPTAPPTETVAAPTAAATAVATATTRSVPSAIPTRPPRPTATAPLAPAASIAALRPDQVRASASAPPSQDSLGSTTTFEPTNAIDSQPETAWRVAGDGRGQWIELSFSRPVEVRQVQILPGYAKIDPSNGVDRFAQNRRVQRVRLEFSDGSNVEAEFADIPELQAVPVSVAQTTFVRIVILATIPPRLADGREFTPISEIVVRGIAS